MILTVSLLLNIPATFKIASGVSFSFFSAVIGMKVSVGLRFQEVMWRERAYCRI